MTQLTGQFKYVVTFGKARRKKRRIMCFSVFRIKNIIYLPLFFSLFLKDVMVVGEPTLMGGEFGDEDERLITRLENTQYDATNGLDDEDDFNSSPALGNNAPWSSKAPAAQDSKPESTAPQPSQ